MATNNFVAVSQYYPQLAEAEEKGEYGACDEALVRYFSQNKDAISKSVTTPRMIQTTAGNPSVPTPTPTPTATPTPTPKPEATPSVTPSATPTPKVTEKPGRAKIKSAKSKKKTITIKLAKIKNARKYEIRYATNKKFKKAKGKTTKKLICTLKKLKRGTTYYIKVRAVNGSKSGKWSKVKKVRVK